MVTQEQFTQSWDVFTDWETMMAQDDTAGRYGWHTNLYQMGVVRMILARIMESSSMLIYGLLN